MKQSLKKSIKCDLKQAAEILREYSQPHSMIDNGNLFFAAGEYQTAYDAVLAELMAAREALDLYALETRPFGSQEPLKPNSALQAVHRIDAFTQSLEGK